jgi:hypothetical protein
MNRVKDLHPREHMVNVLCKHSLKHLQTAKERCGKRHILSLKENFSSVETPLSVSLSNPPALVHLHVGRYPTMLPHIQIFWVSLA